MCSISPRVLARDIPVPLCHASPPRSPPPDPPRVVLPAAEPGRGRQGGGEDEEEEDHPAPGGGAQQVEAKEGAKGSYSKQYFTTLMMKPVKLSSCQDIF